MRNTIKKQKNSSSVSLFFSSSVRAKRGGFTLIELLVVVAIIGILSSIVLASLNTARRRGQNAAIRANVANARTAAELYYDDNAPNGYDGVCDSPNGILPMVTALEDISSDVICNADDDYWVLAAELASYVCTDHTGVLVTVSTMSANPIACPVGITNGVPGDGGLPPPLDGPPVLPVAATYCGDGTVQKPNDAGVYEECDDGNPVSGDGCSSSCQKEAVVGPN